MGTYYLGDNRELYLENSFEELILHIKEQNKIRKMIFVGSSKGGSAALIYGLRMNVQEIVAGSPQYRIGDYLTRNDYHKLIFNGIFNNANNYTDGVAFLNTVIDTALNDNLNHTKVKIVYSEHEEDRDDVLELANNIKKKGIQVDLYDEQYLDHSDISKCFPRYLKEIG